MTQYIVTIHVCGGSQAEAAYPQAALGPYVDKHVADAVADEIYELASARSVYLADEMLTCVTPIQDPPQPNSNDLAIVTKAVLGSYFEDEEDDALPLNHPNAVTLTLNRLDDENFLNIFRPGN